ncbi:MAG: hypothetical protein PHT84_01165, partial [Candidatus Pacebacteria bacterium]|nr:hypothetical protein [Candidatus Paceibacterota bacterium]
MMKFFKKIKKPIVGFIFVLLMFFGFGDFDTLKTSSQLTIKKASAASINICTGNYSVPSKKITPHGAILKNGSVFNWINATQYDTYFNVITCNSYNDDKNLESWRVDNYTDWFQYDCNGSWLGGVSWKKQQWIFPAYTPSHTVSCLNIPSASCSSTSGCTLVSHTLPAFGSCSGNNYPSELKLISNTTGGDTRVRIQQFSVNSV